MTPLSGVGVKNLGLIAEARKHFGEITKANAEQVKAWVRAERERRGLDSGRYEPPANVRKFEPVEPLADEDGLR
jgi:hypothetical protein